MRNWFMWSLAVTLCLGGTAVATCPAPVIVSKPVVSYGATYSTYSTYAEPVKVVQAVAAYVPLAVAYPVYSTGYAPPTNAPGPQPAAAAAPAAPKTDAVMLEMLAELKKMNGRIDTLENNARYLAPPPGGNPANYFAPSGVGNGYGAPQQPPPPAQPAPGGIRPTTPGPAAQAGGHAKGGVFTAKCAACHQRGNESKGGGFVLTEKDGSLLKLSYRSQAKMRQHVYNSTMPPRDNEYKIPPLTDQEAAEGMAALDALN